MLYLETRHNQVARIIRQELLQNDKLDFNPQRVTQKDQLELWWEIDAKTVTKVKKNKSDIMLWDREQKTCQLIETTVPLDTNLKEAYHQKEIKYIPLISEMQRLYKEYKFSTTIITIGALGAVPKIPKHTSKSENRYTKGENRYHNPEDRESCPNWNFKHMEDCHENVERDFRL